MFGLDKFLDIGNDRRDWDAQAKDYCDRNNITDPNTVNSFKQAYMEMRTVFQYGAQYYGTQAKH